MSFDDNIRKEIYNRTNGYCHVCGKKLSLINYGCFGMKAAWEVEHSVPKSKGGTDHLNNLFPSCIRCNRGKGTMTTRTARAWHGRKRAPLSKEKRNGAKRSNAAIAGSIFGVIGYIAAGKLGAFAGMAIGAKLGYDANVDDE